MGNHLNSVGAEYTSVINYIFGYLFIYLILQYLKNFKNYLEIQCFINLYAIKKYIIIVLHLK